jgi:hypothetical protein
MAPPDEPHPIITTSNNRSCRAFGGAKDTIEKSFVLPALAVNNHRYTPRHLHRTYPSHSLSRPQLGPVPKFEAKEEHNRGQRQPHNYGAFFHTSLRIFGLASGG